MEGESQTLNCDKECHDFNKYTFSVHKTILSNLTYVLIYSLTIWQQYDSNFENFVIFAEECPWKSLLKEAALCRVSISLEGSAPPNMIS